jgi:hypothetical protein
MANSVIFRVSSSDLGSGRSPVTQTTSAKFCSGSVSTFQVIRSPYFKQFTGVIYSCSKIGYFGHSVRASSRQLPRLTAVTYKGRNQFYEKFSDKIYCYKKRTSPHVCPILVLSLKYQYCNATFFQDHALLKALPN